MDTKEFIQKAEIVHAGEGLDYSYVDYVNNRTKVKIIDPVYGEFWQTPSNHLKGQSHPLRRAAKISNSKSLTTSDVVKRFEEKHKGEGLDYSKVRYVNMHTKVCIIDPIYGEFWQEPVVHLKGCVHPKRAIDKHSEGQRYTTDSFKKLCQEVHPYYNLEKVVYKSSQEKVCVICPKHGEFYSNPDSLLQGKGCPKCGNHLSKGEDELFNILCKKLGGNNVIKGDKKELNGMEIDILIPPTNIGIEFDGLRWHSEKFKNDKNYHLNKTLKCKERGVSLIHIFEDEWLFHKSIVLTKIENILGINNVNKIPARKCVCKEIDNILAKDFLNKNHIQGYAKSSVYIGCFYENSLVGVMTFIGKNGIYELNRYATDNKIKLVGGGGKLFSYFKKNYKPIYVKSFLDRRWCFDCDNNIYTKLGFVLDKVEPPNYSYTNGHGLRMHKFGFRKQILHKKYGLPLSMTESEMTKHLGYYRIWDCGLFKYVWKNPEVEIKAETIIAD